MDETITQFDAWFPYEKGETINMVRDVSLDAWLAATELQRENIRRRARDAIKTYFSSEEPGDPAALLEVLHELSDFMAA